MYKKIIGKVIDGNKLGRVIGFRTANIELNKTNILEGTYKINGIINGKVYSGVGVKVEEKSIFEAHFFDFSQDIYGEVIEIMILYKIRENIKFKNLDDLKNQIKKDIKLANGIKDHVLTFGTFDKLHPGHNYYLNQAKLYGDILVTIVGTDNNVEKFKGKKTVNNLDLRVKNLQQLGIIDVICKGKEKDYLTWISLYNPKVVCLGYDQKGFWPQLDNFIKENNLDINIFRIDSYRPDIHKSSKI